MSRSAKVVITNPVGLYAAPAQELVDYVKQYNSDITLTYAGKTVNLKSLMGVVSLGIPKKAEIIISAEGYDENKAVREIQQKMHDIELI